MAELEKEIAKVESTMLGWEDHGILTCMLHMRFGAGGSGGQGAGGYTLDAPVHGPDGSGRRGGTFLGRRGTGFGMEWVARVMKACGVREWAELPGRTVFVLREGGRMGKIVGIEPLPTEGGETFMFDDLTGAWDLDAGQWKGHGG